MNQPLSIHPIHEETIGFSSEERPIVIRYYNCPVGQRQVNTLFFGAFHGDEAISTDLLDRFHTELMQHPDLLEDLPPFAIVPCVNPDGLARNSRVNVNGVDLNRNFPTEDWAELHVGEIYYSGPEAASEIETQIVLKVLEACAPQKVVSIHSPYKVINYDGPALALAHAMSAQSGYEVVDSIGYATPGSFGTYVGKEGNVPIITLELPPSEPPDDEPLDKVWQENQMALLEAIRFELN